MKIAIATAICLAASFSATAQSPERKGGAVIAADFDYRATLDRCAVQRQGSGATVVAKLFVRFQPDQRMAKSDGLDIDVDASSGDVPTISAHAINTKGTGSNNGRAAAQSCDIEPSPRGSIPSGRAAVTEAATCSVSSGADGVAWSFTLPLAVLTPDAAAKKYVGHVTLIKRGDDASGMRIVAACSSADAIRAGYDLAVGKKV